MSSDSSKKGKLFILSGPSGAGKGTICKELLERAEPGTLCLSVSMTTREPREGEKEGIHYYFVDEETFAGEIDNDGLLEYAEVYGRHYGTPKEKVLEKLNEGVDVLLEIEMQGALKVRKAYEDGVFVFILPPSMAELRKRITGRGTETRDVIDYRMSKALEEISYIDKYDYVVVNDDLDEAVSRVQAIIKAEHSKVTKDIYSLIEEYKEDN